ncbi:MAG TPA: hypothetical protein VM098_04625 [Phycisphaerae bacterium]|nr:hypothetical protein [Phycisphaerae bacterium]
MIKPVEQTVAGVVGPDGQVRLDRPLEMKPGPVEVTVRAAGPDADSGQAERSILGMAGVGADLWEQLDVENWLSNLRSEWDRRTR